MATDPQASPDATGTEIDSLIRVGVIGRMQRREFEGVRHSLTQSSTFRVVHRFDRAVQAISEPEALSNCDLIIVLQSWSEQYARSEIHQLIGLAFGQHLICFCGPWCESDGRNFELWPDAVRIPAREATTALKQTAEEILSDGEPLPATAARDEVFAARVPLSPTPSEHSRLPQINAAVIGPDVSLRRTLAGILKSLKVRTAVKGLIRVIPYQTIPRVQTPRGPIHAVFHDLDPYSELVHESLAGCRQMFPEALIAGIANMADAGLKAEIIDEDLDIVLAKSNLMADAQEWLLDRISSPPTASTDV